MADFTTPFAANGGRRFPTNDELQNGFPCGPADRELFNALFWQLQSEVHSVVDEAGLTPNNSQNDWLLQAIQALISAATGGNPDGYILMTQAQARLPIFPEVLNADGRIVVTSPATGTVRLPGGVDFLHRGIFSVTTSQTDFATAASKIYHLRWTLSGGFELKDLADGVYNPGALSEDNVAFDSKLDDMLVARVVTNGSNVSTITNLANKANLSVAKLIEGTGGVDLGVNNSRFSIVDNFNWARRPTTFDLSLAKGFSSGSPEDNDFNIRPLGATSTDLTQLAPLYDINRYRISQTVMRDVTNSLWMNFAARA